MGSDVFGAAVRRLAVAGVFLAVILPLGATAQSPPSCEDSLRTVRVYAETLANVRQRVELDAAQTIAALLKRIEQLQAEVTALTKAKKALPAGPDKPKE